MNEKIEAIVRAWPQWSRHEVTKLDAITEEILDHCRNGTGNGFIRKWCEYNLAHLFTKESAK